MFWGRGSRNHPQGESRMKCGWLVVTMMVGCGGHLLVYLPSTTWEVPDGKQGKTQEAAPTDTHHDLTEPNTLDPAEQVPETPSVMVGLVPDLNDSLLEESLPAIPGKDDLEKQQAVSDIMDLRQRFGSVVGDGDGKFAEQVSFLVTQEPKPAAADLTPTVRNAPTPSESMPIPALPSSSLLDEGSSSLSPASTLPLADDSLPPAATQTPNLTMPPPDLIGQQNSAPQHSAGGSSIPETRHPLAAPDPQPSRTPTLPSQMPAGQSVFSLGGTGNGIKSQPIRQVDQIRQVARQLDQIAADLEEKERYETADQIRSQAQSLREACR